MANASHDNLMLAAMLKASAEKAPTYYELLGRFVTAYARAEVQVHVLTRHYSTAADPQARIILYRIGLVKMTSLLRELMQSQKFTGGMLSVALNQSIYDDVDACLSQLAIISAKRGDLVHRTSLLAADGFQISNIHTAKELAKYEQSLITSLELKQMTHDCGIIFLRLSRITNPEFFQKDDDVFDDLLTGPPPWQYKLPEQAPPKAKKMKARKARKLQQRASRGKQPGSGN